MTLKSGTRKLAAPAANTGQPQVPPSFYNISVRVPSVPVTTLVSNFHVGRQLWREHWRDGTALVEIRSAGRARDAAMGAARRGALDRPMETGSIARGVYEPQ